MRDLVIRGEWVERVVYLTIIIVLLGLLTYKFVADCPSCDCSAEDNIVVNAENTIEDNTTEETIIENITTQDVINETGEEETAAENTTETEDDVEEIETLPDDEVSFEIMDVSVHIGNEGTDSEYGKITQLYIRIKNGYSHSFTPQLRLFLYEESDSLEDKQNFKRIVLDTIKKRTVFLNNIDITSTSVRNLENTKKVKVELYDNDIGELIERVIISKDFK